MRSSTRRLLTTWLALMVLMGMAGFIADVSQHGTLSPAALIALAAVTAVKARLVLAQYLQLRSAPAFLNGLTVAAVAVLAIVTVTFVVDFRTPGRPGVRSVGPAASVAIGPSSIPRRPARE